MKTGLKYFFFLTLFFSVSFSFAQKGKAKEKTGITAKYDMAGPFCNGLARVKLNHKWGFIDSTGGVVVSPKYNEVSNFSDGMAKVRMGRKWGMIDTKGNVAIKLEFDFIGDFVDGAAKVMIEGDTYYMDRAGNRIK